jgi:hypothetical protein
MEQAYYCACCGVKNETVIEADESGRAEFVEDCRVCCCPNVIIAQWNSYSEQFDVTVYREDVG